MKENRVFDARAASPRLSENERAFAVPRWRAPTNRRLNMFIPPPGNLVHAQAARPHPTGSAQSKKESERAQMNAKFQQSISNAYKPQRYNPDAPPQWTASAPHKKNSENQQAMDPFDQARIWNAE